MHSDIKRRDAGVFGPIIKGRASTRGVVGISDVTRDIYLTKKI